MTDMNTYLISAALTTLMPENYLVTENVKPFTLNDSHKVEQNEMHSLRLGISMDFANGDFTSISSSTKTGPLHKGDGSRAMVSIRQFRF